VDVTTVDRHLAAPLLGVTRRGAFVHSWLERGLQGAAPRTLSGDLSLSGYLVPGARRHYSLTGERSAGGASAISFTAMKARVSYPRVVT
jgi:hypothetical protein